MICVGRFFVIGCWLLDFGIFSVKVIVSMKDAKIFFAIHTPSSYLHSYYSQSLLHPPSQSVTLSHPI
jgi:hypothetical protein